MSRTRTIRTLALLVAAAAPALLLAQHQHPPAAAEQPNQAAVARCVQAHRQVLPIIEAADRRLEAARQTNDPPAMRAAIADLQGALRQIRAQLEPCGSLGGASDPDAPKKPIP
jgi:hypothetical protein